VRTGREAGERYGICASRLFRQGVGCAKGVGILRQIHPQAEAVHVEILAKPPEEYFPEVEARFPGALASQWSPLDRNLWRIENYPAFLEQRRQLLANDANSFLTELLHGAEIEVELPATEEADTEVAEPSLVTISPPRRVPPEPPITGGVESEDEERLILECNNWVTRLDLPGGEYMFELVDSSTGQPVALLDLAWPSGLQEGLSQPVALLIDEGPVTYSLANAAGFRYFTSVEAFKAYVQREVLALQTEDEELPVAV
jgi:hypothetical protein